MYHALIIDDEKPAQIAISALGSWHDLGIELPFTANNGKDGLFSMRELHPDIVFVDMQMPLMNGLEFLKTASAEFPGTKFIIISGYDYFEYAQSGIKHGAIDYLLKPVVEDELNSALKKAVELLNNDRNIEDIQPIPKDSHIPPEKIAEIIKDYIDQNYCQDIKISMFSDKYFFSKEYLSRLFKKKYSSGIYEYALTLRMERALALLQDRNLQIQEISERLGYSNNNYFSKAFKNYFNVSPSDYRATLY